MSSSWYKKKEDKYFGQGVLASNLRTAILHNIIAGTIKWGSVDRQQDAGITISKTAQESL